MHLSRKKDASRKNPLIKVLIRYREASLKYKERQGLSMPAGEKWSLATGSKRASGGRLHLPETVKCAIFVSRSLIALVPAALVSRRGASGGASAAATAASRNLTIKNHMATPSITTTILPLSLLSGCLGGCHQATSDKLWSTPNHLQTKSHAMRFRFRYKYLNRLKKSNKITV